MLRPRTGALAVDLGPRIGAVDFDVFDPATRHDVNAALGAAAAFESDENLVLDLHVPGVVVFAGLNYRARCRHGIAAALHLDRVEIRPVGEMVRRIALPLIKSPGLKS